MGLCASCDLPADHHCHHPQPRYNCDWRPDGYLPQSCNVVSGYPIYLNAPLPSQTNIDHDVICQIPPEYQQNYYSQIYDSHDQKYKDHQDNYILPPPYNPYR